MPRRSRSSSRSGEEGRSDKKKRKKEKHKKTKKKKHKESKKSSKKKKEKKKHEEEPSDVPPTESIGSLDKSEKVGVSQFLAGDTFGMVEKKILQLGAGPRPVRGQQCVFHCTARMQQTGKVFWRTQKKAGEEGVFVSDSAFTLFCGLATAIKGLDEGLLFMRKGEIAELVVTGNFGYGVEGFPPWQIPPMCDLVFLVSLIDIGSEIRTIDKATLVRKHLEQRTFKGWQLTQMEYLLPGGSFFRKNPHTTKEGRGKGQTFIPGSWSVCI